MNPRTTLFRRVALASVFALGVAACGDNVVTVPPTPAMTVSPSSLTILPGQTGQFSVSFTGTENTAFTVGQSGAVSETAVSGNVVTVTVATGASAGQTGSV
jgi:hypothetical protein